RGDGLVGRGGGVWAGRADGAHVRNVRTSVMLFRASKIWKSFAGVRALADVSFQLRAGEVHALVGESGAGKSTLIKIITGAQQPDEGTLELAGQKIERNDPVEAR